MGTDLLPWPLQLPPPPGILDYVITDIWHKPMCYDRQGRPISLAESGRLRAQPGYHRVGETFVGQYRVSTVWLGLDHAMPWSPYPMIFETMVFTIVDGEPDMSGEFEHRYWTEQQALDGHEAVVGMLRELEGLSWGCVE